MHFDIWTTKTAPLSSYVSILFQKYLFHADDKTEKLVFIHGIAADATGRR